MKICLINNLYPPYAVGGAERVVENEARKLAAEGKEVVVITSRPWSGFSSWKPEAGKDGEVVVYRFFPLNIFWYKDLGKHKFFAKLLWHFLDIFNFASARIIRQILEKEKPDEVWTHNLMGLSYKIFPPRAGSRCGGTNFKWVHYLHDVQLVEPSGVLPWNHEKDKFYQKIYSWIMKKRLGSPDVVVALSNFIEDFYWSRGFFSGAKWDVEKSKVSRERDPVFAAGKSQKSKVLGEPLKFLFVGSLVEHKGIRVLMQAWDEVCHSRENGNPEMANSLHIIGDGFLRPQVEEWAKNFKNVNVCGRLEGEDLRKVYENCDILIFPSICLENRPTVILEALEHGLPIIAADTGGVRELVNPNENAWLFEPGDVEGLVKRMKRFV